MKHPPIAQMQIAKKIAIVIDSYLPGTYDNILRLCNTMKMKDMYALGLLVSGAPGWGKVSSIEYLISATNAQKIIVSYNDLLRSKDGAKYAEDLLNKYKNKKEPLIMVCDEFEMIADEANKDISALIYFFDKIKEIVQNTDNNINLKLIIAISNINKERLHPGIINHLINKCFVFGNNPDYNRIINLISQCFKCDSSESKEDFVNNIAENCKNLRSLGKAPTARVIVKAFQTAKNGWLEKNSGIKPWNAVLNSQDIIEKINSICKL